MFAGPQKTLSNHRIPRFRVFTLPTLFREVAGVGPLRKPRRRRVHGLGCTELYITWLCQAEGGNRLQAP